MQEKQYVNQTHVCKSKQMQLHYHDMNMQCKNANDLPTHLGPEAVEVKTLKMSGEIVQPMQPTDHLIKVSPHVLNYVIQQR
jgi:hypothetical protein